MTTRLLTAESSVLLVVDIQERFVPVIADIERVIRNTAILIDAARELGMPVIVSEQYPKGLGRTDSGLANRLPDSARVVEKTAFGCLGCDELRNEMAACNRSQVVVCGIETHVCVNQTTHQLLEAGYEVHLVSDAVSSRDPANHTAGMTKMIQSGVVPACTEMAVFELMRDAVHPAFKTLQALVK